MFFFLQKLKRVGYLDKNIANLDTDTGEVSSSFRASNILPY